MINSVLIWSSNHTKCGLFIKLKFEYHTLFQIVGPIRLCLQLMLSTYFLFTHIKDGGKIYTADEGSKYKYVCFFVRKAYEVTRF